MIVKTTLYIVFLTGLTTMIGREASAQQSPDGEWQTVEVEGIKFSWSFVSGRLLCELEAPTTGWIAMGFNT